LTQQQPDVIRSSKLVFDQIFAEQNNTNGSFSIQIETEYLSPNKLYTCCLIINNFNIECSILKLLNSEKIIFYHTFEMPLYIITFLSGVLLVLIIFSLVACCLKLIQSYGSTRIILNSSLLRRNSFQNIFTINNDASPPPYEECACCREIDEKF
jgi:hypothetical protein